MYCLRGELKISVSGGGLERGHKHNLLFIINDQQILLIIINMSIPTYATMMAQSTQTNSLQVKVTNKMLFNIKVK